MQHNPWQLVDRTATLRLPRLSAALDLARPERGLHDLRFDGAPLAETAPAGKSFDGVRLLCVDRIEPLAADATLSIEDQYVRGRDLIVTYEETAGSPIRWQIYWRVLTGDSLPGDSSTDERCSGLLAGVELIASVQTSLLDGDPRMRSASTLQADEALQLVDPASAVFERWTPPAQHSPSTGASSIGASSTGADRAAGCFLFRLPGGGVTYAEMIHPADFRSSQWSLERADESDGATAQRRGLFTIRHPLFDHRLEKGVLLRCRLQGLLLDRANDAATAAACYERFAREPPPLTA